MKKEKEEKMAKGSKKTALFFVAFLFLATPNFNIIDVLPDFFAYFMFARLFRDSKEIVPHFEEAHAAFVRLFYLSIAKLPALVIMFFNMYSGRDIVPLFALIFSVIEGLLLFSAVNHSAEGLFYLAGRTDAKPVNDGSYSFGVRLTPDGMKWLTVAFALTKCTLTVIPELCLLSTSNATLKAWLANVYPIALIVCMATILVFGIFWLVAMTRYTSRIVRGCDLAEEIKRMAGEEKLFILANNKRVRRITTTLTVLAAASIFSFDLTFENTGGVNVLPHFIWAFLLCYSGVRLFGGRYKTTLPISTALYTVFSLLSHYRTVIFYEEFDQTALMDNARAIREYASVKLFSALELCAFVILISFMITGFAGFIKKHTGVDPKSEGYSKTEISYHRSIITKGSILFTMMMLIQLGKCAGVFLDAEVKLIGTATGVVVTSPTPWLGTVLMLLSVALIVSSFFFISGVKADVHFKYDVEQSDTKKGVYE